MAMDDRKNDYKYRVTIQEQRNGGEWTDLPVVEETTGVMLFCMNGKRDGMQCVIQNLTASDIAMFLAHSPDCRKAILIALPAILLAEKLKINASREIDAEALLTNLAKNSGGGYRRRAIIPC
jgi:hypothetical protein